MARFLAGGFPPVFATPEVEEGAGEGDPDRDGEGLEHWDESFDVFGFSIHGFSLGGAGVVYWERAAIERSQRLGAHTPTRTRHAEVMRLPLLTLSA